MLYAKNENNNRISPSKDLEAYCPLCGEKVKAICGEIYVHHWRHDKLINCDTWKEKETDWHRNWKSEFPTAWQEYIITKGNEKHIADIRTENGLILELQNSSISSSTVRIREEFYGKMVWLINAENFKDNFKINSAVNTKLRELRQSYTLEILNNNSESEFGVEKAIIEDLRFDLRQIDSSIEQSEQRIKKYRSYLNDIEVAYKEVTKHNYWGELNSFKTKKLKELEELFNTFDDFTNSENENFEMQERINRLSNCQIINYEKYKIVDFKDVSQNSFRLCKVVETKTINTFFPIVRDINSEITFGIFSSQKEKYTLLIDLTKKEKEIETILEELKCKKELVQQQINQKKIAIKEELKSFINNRIEEEKQNISNKNDELTYKKKQIEKAESDLKSKYSKYVEDIETYNNRLSSKTKEQEINIKRTYKGYYTYYWKHRRKTWNYANCNLFLDFGNHIFEILDNQKLKKIDKETFIKKIIKWR